MTFETSKDFAESLDDQDPLREFRSEFHIPKTESGRECVYLAGNSLGLQPIRCRQQIESELDDWAKLGVEGHFKPKKPWLSFHETVTPELARLTGAKAHEVVAMNSLTVNLHLMLVSFYRPTPTRNAILIEAGAFPSDLYAVTSQIRYHGYDPAQSLLQLKPSGDSPTLSTEEIVKYIQAHGDSIALILLGNVNYVTGQAFDLEAVTRAGHSRGCAVGFDLAHGVGNLELQLHETGPDFAVWCSYKYLNSGPGALAGCFVHDRHSNAPEIPRFSGWWGHSKSTRFQMPDRFDPIVGVEGWQLSNPPIFQLAALKASLEIFDRATISALRKKSVLLTAYLEFLLDQLGSERVNQITPRNPVERGSQISLRIQEGARSLTSTLAAQGIICDFREPDVMRIAPTALYNRFTDVYHFATALRNALS